MVKQLFKTNSGKRIMYHWSAKWQEKNGSTSEKSGWIKSNADLADERQYDELIDNIKIHCGLRLKDDLAFVLMALSPLGIVDE